jgi:carbon-monoxide dehydrogenase medium subunit
MIPGAFDYHRPQSVEEAVALMSSLGDDVALVAGGHSLIPMMRLRMAVPQNLVDLQDIEALKVIAIDDSTITLGAMVTQAELIASDGLAARCPIIRETAMEIADPQVRNLGTIGGNVANGDPGNDMPAVMQALDASYVLSGPEGSRECKARGFYEAAFFTARADGEILTAIRIPIPAAGHGHAYLKQNRKIGDYATAAAAVILSISGDSCSAAAIGLTNLADTPLFAEDASAALVGSSLDAAAVDAAVDAAKAITAPADDGRGPAEFRIHVAGVMLRRAIEKAQARSS